MRAKQVTLVGADEIRYTQAALEWYTNQLQQEKSTAARRKAISVAESVIGKLLSIK